MIRLDEIGKQSGNQIVFIEASAALQRGEKVGLVGPNGAGKTTLFRLITGQEQPDEGIVSSDRGVVIGDFSQDVGEMSGRSAVAEVMGGSGRVSAVAAEGTAADEAELRGFVAARLAAYKVSVRIVVWDGMLPRNPAGKILRRELRGALVG